jgi:hypothetical protein
LRSPHGSTSPTGSTSHGLDAWQPSIGLLVVEMRTNDAARNAQLLALLRAHGFELVRTLKVWLDRIVDNVFLRAEHFGHTNDLPPAALELLEERTLRKGALAYSPRWANLHRRRGRLRGARRYVVDAPELLWRCTNSSSC